MACKNCFNNCGGQKTSDQCVEYTGSDIPLLGVCQGDQLSKLEDAIVTYLLSALDGTGITVEDVTLDNCVWLKNQFIGKDKTLVNLLQLLIDANCTLKGLIDNLTPGSTSFDAGCLELPENPTPTDILQAVVVKLCSLSETVDGIPSTYVKLTDLDNLIQQYLNTTSGGGGGSTPVYNQRLVPYVAMAYFGPLSNFDPDGKGFASLGFDKIYICNGSFGTPDMRGRKVTGAVRNIPGALPLDAAVDPLNANNPNTNYAIGDKFGESYHKLVIPEIPAHGHNVVDPGHSHGFEGVVPDGRGSDGAKAATVSNKQTQTATTGISVGSTGGDLVHENRDPSIAGVWIMFIP